MYWFQGTVYWEIFSRLLDMGIWNKFVKHTDVGTGPSTSNRKCTKRSLTGYMISIAIVYSLFCFACTAIYKQLGKMKEIKVFPCLFHNINWSRTCQSQFWIEKSPPSSGQLKIQQVTIPVSIFRTEKTGNRVLKILYGSTEFSIYWVFSSDKLLNISTQVSVKVLKNTYKYLSTLEYISSVWFETWIQTSKFKFQMTTTVHTCLPSPSVWERIVIWNLKFEFKFQVWHIWSTSDIPVAGYFEGTLTSVHSLGSHPCILGYWDLQLPELSAMLLMVSVNVGDFWWKYSYDWTKIYLYIRI